MYLANYLLESTCNSSQHNLRFAISYISYEKIRISFDKYYMHSIFIFYHEEKSNSLYCIRKDRNI